jgi:hypothetical protein
VADAQRMAIPMAADRRGAAGLTAPPRAFVERICVRDIYFLEGMLTLKVVWLNDCSSSGRRRQVSTSLCDRWEEKKTEARLPPEPCVCVGVPKAPTRGYVANDVKNRMSKVWRT